MNKYYAYEIIRDGHEYCLYIHTDRAQFGEEYPFDADSDTAHRLGIIRAESMRDAIQHVADGNWDYEEYNS